jgi:hypothetical protein
MGGTRRGFRILLEYLVNLGWMGGIYSGGESHKLVHRDPASGAMPESALLLAREIREP